MSVRKLSKELQNKANKELKEDPSKIQDQLKVIRDWAKTQPHLNISPDDQWLLNFLRRCNFDLEVAKERLDLFLTIRTSSPELITNRDPFSTEMQHLLKSGVCLPLPQSSDPTAPRVVLVRIEAMDITKFKIDDMIKLALMIIDMLITEEDSYSICGVEFFIDSSGFTMSHFLEGMSTFQKFNKCTHEAYGLIPHGVHIVKASPRLLTTFDMSKSMVDAEYLDLIHFYNEDNMDDVFKAIPASILPEEYGGSAGSVQSLTDELKKRVESRRDWFLQDAKYCSDENKRPGGPKRFFNECSIDW